MQLLVNEVHQVDNYEVLQLRNQVLPLLRLGRPAREIGNPSSLCWSFL